MKKSAFNIIIDTPKGRIAYNSLSNKLFQTGLEFNWIIENINSINADTIQPDYKSVFDEMCRSSFIIDDGFDELEALRTRNEAVRNGRETLGLTIAPTLECNFDCPYCYENRVKGIMSNEIQDRIIGFFKKKAESGAESLNVNWYGGEPTLAINVIKRLTASFMNVCAENNIKYRAFIVSNGYLIDESMAGELAACGIKHAQITIDGPSAIHDARRRLKRGGPTFDKCLAAVKYLVKMNIGVNIRVNIDKNNINYFGELLDALAANGMQNIPVTPGRVAVLSGVCKSVENDCLDMAEFSCEKIKLSGLLSSKGFKSSRRLPKRRDNYCCAERTNGFVIDAAGAVYKCWNDIGIAEKSIGNLGPDGLLETAGFAYCAYSKRDPLAEERCQTCRILPLCMGGCPAAALNNGEPACEEWKYNIERFLIEAFMESLK